MSSSAKPTWSLPVISLSLSSLSRISLRLSAFRRLISSFFSSFSSCFRSRVSCLFTLRRSSFLRIESCIVLGYFLINFSASFFCLSLSTSPFSQLTYSWSFSAFFSLLFSAVFRRESPSSASLSSSARAALKLLLSCSSSSAVAYWPLCLEDLRLRALSSSSSSSSENTPSFSRITFRS
uniref:Uncharacterized protein n=1 Tax=Ixodes ricinus TaxID=34613 RepID=A0A6B0UZV3_IXORI